MTIDEDTLLDAMELIAFMNPHVPGLFERVEFETPSGGAPLRGGWSPRTSWYSANLVAAPRLEAGDVDAMIATVHDHFTAVGHDYGWYLVPSRMTPPDLGARLERAGLHLAAEMDGLCRTDLDIGIDPNPALEVREVGEGDGLADLVQVYELGYPMPRSAAEAGLEVSIAAGARSYVVYLDGAPISAASMMALPDLPQVTVLSGAATIAEHRGQGAYSALVQRRMQDAKASGCEAVIIQAVKGTSAPICRAFGFTKLVDLAIYAHVADPVD